MSPHTVTPEVSPQHTSPHTVTPEVSPQHMSPHTVTPEVCPQRLSPHTVTPTAHLCTQNRPRAVWRLPYLMSSVFPHVGNVSAHQLRALAVSALEQILRDFACRTSALCSSQPQRNRYPNFTLDFQVKVVWKVVVISFACAILTQQDAILVSFGTKRCAFSGVFTLEDGFCADVTNDTIGCNVNFDDDVKKMTAGSIQCENCHTQVHATIE